MRRDTFLRATAGSMAAVALAPLSSAALASDVVEFNLTAAPLTFSPVSGLAFPGRAFNGTIPGPLLRVAHGQRMRATFRNESGSPATIHWHGMILPNAMDGVEGVTQKAVANGASFVYEFEPNPIGTRWYHDHIGDGLVRGMFGMFVVDDPNETKPDAEFALVFHDVPKLPTLQAAMMGTSDAPMVDPMDSPEMRNMQPNDRMGDEVAYAAHCINGASYPKTASLPVSVGQRVRLRILNANFTQTRYVRLAGHKLTITHGDGNQLAQPVEVDALRLGVGERYDAWFEVTKPGAWLLQGLSSDPLSFQQAAIVYTPGYENATPLGNPQTLMDVDYFTYEKAGAASSAPFDRSGTHRFDLVLGGGEYGSSRWTIDGKRYPNTPKLDVKRNEIVTVRFTNKTDMDHPMHLHGHVFEIVEVDGKALQRAIPKDTSLVRANGGTITWRLKADSPAGRWLLHCHNDVHMMDGMMTELVYTG